MSILIEDLIDRYKDEKKITYWRNINKKWYIAKHLPFYSIGAFWGRVKDSWRVLWDKSRAYHYKEDE